jgi:phosphatidylglycerophosphate synthase
MVASVGIALHGAAGVVLAVLGIAILALDGLDGWLARRGNSASEFGAHFDMETDALFVLVMTFELWHRHQLEGWILISCLLRYAYCCARAGAAARRICRVLLRTTRIYATGIGLCAAFALPNARRGRLRGDGRGSASFMRSFTGHRDGARPLRLS